MPTLLLLALLTWPFGHPQRPGHTHSRAYHARHLAHLHESRARLLSRRHAAHPSLIHF